MWVMMGVGVGVGVDVGGHKRTSMVMTLAITDEQTLPLSPTTQL